MFQVSNNFLVPHFERELLFNKTSDLFRAPLLANEKAYFISRFGGEYLVYVFSTPMHAVYNPLSPFKIQIGSEFYAPS